MVFGLNTMVFRYHITHIKVKVSSGEEKWIVYWLWLYCAVNSE